jgi:hypothetical protein
MPRSDRSSINAHRGLQEGRRVSPHHTSTPIRSWSLPLVTVLRWMVGAVLVLASLSLFGDVALEAVRGWLA